MKWLSEVWGLFVDDPNLAALTLIALAVGAVLAHAGLRQWAGLMVFLIVVSSLWYSIRSD